MSRRERRNSFYRLVYGKLGRFYGLVRGANVGAYILITVNNNFGVDGALMEDVAVLRLYIINFNVIRVTNLIYLE